MIEMALVILILLILTFGVADMGLYMYKYVQAANCTREAARRAVVRDPNPTSVPYCIDASLKPSLSANPADLPAGAEITATVNTTYSWLVISYLIPGMSNTIPLKSDTSMRMEPKKV
jgi:hypothetical protein